MIYFGDVDVVLKLARCGFLPSIAELLAVSSGNPDIRYLISLRARAKRGTGTAWPEQQRRDLELFCRTYRVIDGGAEVARQESLLLAGMDPGEALLFAEAELTCGTVVTGDKRALECYATVSTAEQRGRIKVVCWEQLLLRVARVHGYDRLCRGCCAALEHDGLLRLAFTDGLLTPEAKALEAIGSYLRGVQRHSHDILANLPL